MKPPAPQTTIFPELINLALPFNDGRKGKLRRDGIYSSLYFFKRALARGSISSALSNVWPLTEQRGCRKLSAIGKSSNANTSDAVGNGDLSKHV
jgi:hypothetical protein